MRLFHLSDIRLDSGYAELCLQAGYGPDRRAAVREAFQMAMASAKNQSVDAVLISGNFFEVDRLRRSTRTLIRETFESLGDIPVFIAPGDRDSLTALSPYQLESWPGNVHLFIRPEWEWICDRDEKLAVLGCASKTGDAPPSINSDGPGDVTKIVCAFAPWSSDVRDDVSRRADAAYSAWGANQEGVIPFAAHTFDDAPSGFLQVVISDGVPSIEKIATDLPGLRSHTMNVNDYDDAQSLLKTIDDAYREFPQDAHRVLITGELPAADASKWLEPIYALEQSDGYVRICDETTLRLEQNIETSGTVSDGVAASLAAQWSDANDPRRRSMLARAQVIASNAMGGEPLVIPGSAQS